MTEPTKKLTNKEFLALSIAERRRLLDEQVNNPEIIEYYTDLWYDEMAMQDKDMCA